MQIGADSDIPSHTRLLILGATGATGRELVDQALVRGHRVTAFVRSPEKLADIRQKIIVCGGDPTDCDELETVLDGQDAVIVALGHRGLGRSDLLRQSAQALVHAMRDTRVHRVLVVSVGLLFSDAGAIARAIGSTFLRNVVRDSARMEGIVASSGLDWTIVRPPKLTNGPWTGEFALSDGHMPHDGGWSISRADLASFLLDEAERPIHDHRIVGIAARRARLGRPIVQPRSAWFEWSVNPEVSDRPERGTGHRAPPRVRRQ